MSDITSIASILSVLIAACGLFITARSIQEQTKATDVSTSFKIFTEIQASEKKLRDLHDNDFSWNIVEPFNLLELLAQLYNSNSLTKQSRIISRDFLLNHLATIKLNNHVKSALGVSVTSSKTYGDLAKFCKENKDALDSREDELRAAQANLSSQRANGSTITSSAVPRSS